MPYNVKADVLEENQLFTCKKCGTCCKGYGGTYVSEADIQEIAAYTGADPDAFVENYCSLSGGKPVLTQQENGFCIFWDEVCTIHPVKPRMCREWPFIPSVLADPANWHVMAASCPGIHKNASMHLVQAHIRRLNPKVATLG